jgi:y4mF family transcriptional regulator
MKVSDFVKDKRGAAKLTQPQLAEKAGVGLRFVRDLEQGKETLRLDKVNQVLKLFGCELSPTPISHMLPMKPAGKEYKLLDEGNLSKAAEE